MGSLFPSKEPSTQDNDNVSDDGEDAPTQDVPDSDTTPDTKMVVDDDDSPF